MKTKCKMCQKRYARPKEWMSEEEQQYCFSCWTFLTYCSEIEKFMTDQLHRLGLKDKMAEIFFSKDDTDTKRLLEAIYNRKYENKFIKDVHNDDGSSSSTVPGKVSL